MFGNIITNNSIKRKKDLQNSLCFNFELNDYIKSSDHFGKGTFRQKNNEKNIVY